MVTSQNLILEIATWQLYSIAITKDQMSCSKLNTPKDRGKTSQNEPLQFLFNYVLQLLWSRKKIPDS